MKTRRLASALLLTALLAGCSISPVAAPSNTPATRAARTPIVDPATGKVLPNQPVEPLNGVAFKPLTQGAAQYLSNGGNQAAGAAVPGVAVAAPASTSISADAAASIGAKSGGSGMMAMPSAAPGGAGGAFSGNIYSNYGYGYYFGGGGGFDQMALVSAQEAEVAGSNGASFQQIIASVAAPVVKDWAADARLTESGAMLTADGQLFIETPPPGASDAKLGMVRPMPGYGYGGNPEGWRLVYVSTERKEMLTFAVGKDKTTIVRLRWAPLDLAPERVTVDSASAVKALAAAIADKGFQSEEEKTRKDYFMGYAFDQPATGEWDGPEQKTEVLYAVPGDARWNVSLQQVMGKLVWQINWWAPYADENMPQPMVAPVMDGGWDASKPCPAPVKQTNTWVNNNGQGMVDAETGAVIRFSRPTKTTNTWEQQMYPCYEGKPVPTPMPSAAPTAPPAEEKQAAAQ